MVSSLVFSRFSWNKFSADQLETWSTASCALLCCPFGTFSDKVVSSTYFHIPKSALGVTRSLIMSKKSQGPNLVPWGTPAGTTPHSDKQSRLSFTLWDRSDIYIFALCRSRRVLVPRRRIGGHAGVRGIDFHLNGKKKKVV